MAIKVLVGLNVRQTDGSEVRIEPGGQMTRWTPKDDGSFTVSPFGGSLESVLTPAVVTNLLRDFHPPVIELSEAAAFAAVAEPEEENEDGNDRD